MNVSKKIVLAAMIVVMLCGFSSNAFAREVLYAPFETYLPLEPGFWTTIYIGENLSSVQYFLYGNPAHVTGRVGYALDFDGSDYIQVSSVDGSLNLGYDDFAITFWVKTTSTKTINTVSDKRDSSGNGYHVALYTGRPLLQMHDTGYGIYNYYPSSSTNGSYVADGLWHKVSIYVERDNTAGGKMYVDGLCVLTFNPTRHTGSLSNTVPLLIGKHKDSSSYNFDGILDEYRHFRYIPK